jgi:hypothetical protein
VVQLRHEVAHLVLETGDLTVTLGQLLLLALQIVRFLVDQSIQLLDLVQTLRDFKLKVADVPAEVSALVGLDFVAHIKTVNLCKVISVTLPKSAELVISLPLLRFEIQVRVLGDLELVVDSLDVDITV